MAEFTAKVASASAPYNQLPPICITLHEAKARKKITFEEIGKTLQRDEVWVAAVFYGQARPSHEELDAFIKVLDLPADNELHAFLGPHWWPQRGLGQVPPQDPVIYRLFEGVMVYGQAIKAVIHEKFGDGIMSMIDCSVKIERKPDPKGDRVLLIFDGKFLPYIKW